MYISELSLSVLEWKKQLSAHFLYNESKILGDEAISSNTTMKISWMKTLKIQRYIIHKELPFKQEQEQAKETSLPQNTNIPRPNDRRM